MIGKSFKVLRLARVLKYFDWQNFKSTLVGKSIKVLFLAAASDFEYAGRKLHQQHIVCTTARNPATRCVTKYTTPPQAHNSLQIQPILTVGTKTDRKKGANHQSGSDLQQKGSSRQLPNAREDAYPSNNTTDCHHRNSRGGLLTPIVTSIDHNNRINKATIAGSRHPTNQPNGNRRR